MGLQNIIVNVGARTVCSDVGDDLVSTVEEADGVPVVRDGCVTFLKYWIQVPFGSFVWYRAPYQTEVSSSKTKRISLGSGSSYK